MFILHTILIPTLALITTCLQSMESPAEVALYNATECAFKSVPDDVLMHIFSYCPIHYYVESEKGETYLDTDKESGALLQSINFFLRARKTCNRFDTFLTLQTIGKICKTSYNQYIKNIKTHWLGHYHQPINIILLHAGANLNKNFDYMRNNFFIDNPKFIEILLNHPDLNTPSFFYANRVEQIQHFINKGVNIHKTDKKGLNVLWYAVKYNKADVLDVYLQHNVDATFLYPDSITDHFDELEIDPMGQSCLLHCYTYYFQNNLKIGSLLLKVIPHMINQINTGDKTPLDLAYQSGFTELITLLETHGGKRAQELK